MSKRFFIKQDPHCRKEDTVWVELTGREYYSFLHSPAAEGRHFIRLDDLVLESTKAEYQKRQAELKHQAYLKKYEKNWSTISLYALEKENSLNGEWIIIDATQDVAETVLNSLEQETLLQAIQSLPKEECELIFTVYLSPSSCSKKEIAATHGLTPSGLSKRLKRIRKKLKW